MSKRYAKPVEPKPCPFCKAEVKDIDYKDVDTLKKYMTDRAKIKPKRVTGCCQQHQKKLARAIKLARVMALVPFTTTITSNRIGGRRGHRG
ncbi:MAG: 30S ribosomal protein S18 [Coriobacteriales bacterium]|jgi:small subunit ribosomal protein S18|nr:30S ribosomal protein S18 [Coriobacteriales bacterium]